MNGIIDVIVILFLMLDYHIREYNFSPFFIIGDSCSIVKYTVL